MPAGSALFSYGPFTKISEAARRETEKRRAKEMEKLNRKRR